jgi:hypothetical protein
MEKFLLNIDDKELDDLKFKISQGRIIDWGSYHKDDAGISFKRLSFILDYWKNDFSWKKEENKLNKFQQFLFKKKRFHNSFFAHKIRKKK